MKKTDFLKEAIYEAYKVDWMIRISAARQVDSILGFYEDSKEEVDASFSEYDSYVQEHGFCGELYVSYEEFLENEFLDKEYIKFLIGHSELPQTIKVCGFC